ncbi:hypothetical protein DFH06DRAFT_1195582 [Mycena polygramma]|nr:hypothetical protein DFH06DRAFT_1195582 [Mycena polygramma]
MPQRTRPPSSLGCLGVSAAHTSGLPPPRLLLPSPSAAKSSAPRTKEALHPHSPLPAHRAVVVLSRLADPAVEDAVGRCADVGGAATSRHEPGCGCAVGGRDCGPAQLCRGPVWCARAIAEGQGSGRGRGQWWRAPGIDRVPPAGPNAIAAARGGCHVRLATHLSHVRTVLFVAFSRRDVGHCLCSYTRF